MHLVWQAFPWFIEANTVDACIIMHNIMVETQIERGEEEEERPELYALHNAETPVVDTAVELRNV